jgi:hypothetical protein
LAFFICGAMLVHHSGCAPSLHSWVEVKLEEMFEGDDVDRSFIVGAQGLDAGGHDDVNPRLKHGFQIADCNSFVYRSEEKAKPTRALGHDLAPAFPESSLDRENNSVGRIPAEMLDGWEDKVWLAVDDWLRRERIAKANKEFSYEQFKGLARARTAPLRKAKKKLV